MNPDSKYFVEGPIKIETITKLISNQGINTDKGAHNIFLGQVRADIKLNSNQMEDIKVSRMIYSAYNKMAEKEMKLINDESNQKYKLNDLNIYHSLGEVMAGEISLFVMVSSEHRDNCFDSVKFIVKQIKMRVPIWKKEIYTDGSYRWIE